jgi:hypothetical protein
MDTLPPAARLFIWPFVITFIFGFVYILNSNIFQLKLSVPVLYGYGILYICMVYGSIFFPIYQLVGEEIQKASILYVMLDPSDLMLMISFIVSL